jgi:high-affinity iron transporter
VFKGLVLIGFTSVYREGFEVVLFLQSLRLKAGTTVVLEGVLIGLLLTAMVAVITFIAHHKLPYRKMLVLTGIMLGMVLIVMVGESVQEMQQARWIGTTTINIPMPDWLNTWFAVYPSAESLWAQFFSGLFVIGSYFLAQYLQVWRTPRKS